ncbi:MAG: sialate O-acetylesterase [Ferruginibacter sp.]
MKKVIKIIFTALIIIFCNEISYSQITLSKVFGDKMVLQRGTPVPVWGWANPGTHIVAILAKAKAKAVADSSGKWMLRFPVFKAGGPYTLTIAEEAKPETTIILNDILIGDVWVASGQSNMELEVQQAQNAKAEIANADYPNIRFLVVSHNIKLSPQQDILGGKWEVCDTANVAKFSAVAYYFSRKIHSEQKVPIGIIQTTWGGTPVESWTSREQLLTSPLTKQIILNNDTITEKTFINDSLAQARFWDIVYHPQNNTEQVLTKPNYDDKKWPVVEMPGLIKDFGIGNYEGMMWMRKKIILPAAFSGKDLKINLGHPEMNYSIYFNGKEICKTMWNNNASHSYSIPASLVENGENSIVLRIAMLWNGGGLNPPADEMYITDGTSKISLAGKWLYQKDMEPEVPKLQYYQQYPTLLYNGMVNPLIPYAIKGFIWYQGENNATDAYNYRQLFPMMIADWRQRWQQGKLPFLFVQLANYKKAKPQPSESDWAELREAQAMALKLPNTGMACIIDIGNPDDIHPKNKQEVGRRLALLANRMLDNKNIVANGPVYKNYAIDGNSVRINFVKSNSPLAINKGKLLQGFVIAGEDKHFYWANAVIKDNYILVYAAEVKKPVTVRYAWADDPECNLINAEGLPAAPFRTDTWKGITQK